LFEIHKFVIQAPYTVRITK